jgi:hypothetical protein
MPQPEVEIIQNITTEQADKIIKLLEDILQVLLRLETYANIIFSILIVYIIIAVLYKIVSYFMYSY